MTRQKRSTKNLPSNVFFWLSALCILISVSSCNDSVPENDLLRDSAKLNPPDSSDIIKTGVGTDSIDGVMNILFMERDEFLALPTNPPNHKKLVFQFCVPDTGRNSMTLAVFSNLNREFDPAFKVLHNSWVASQLNVNGQTVFWGHQKVVRHDIERIRDSLQSNTSFKFLVFYPKLVNKRLIYDVYLETTVNADSLAKKFGLIQPSPLISLNPSPPASETED